VLALHGWQVWSDTSSGDVVPFYLLPSLGGKNTLRGYHEYRFHDRDMQVFNVESRLALFAHVDAAVFADLGKVAPRASDLDFTDLKRSYGVGLRVHNATSTLARLDVGHSVEGWRVFFKVSDPFRRSTPASGRSAVVPFVP
jgi:outer membrane protein assembly factor BamA